MRNLTIAVVAGLVALGGIAETARADTIADIVVGSGGEFDNNRFDYDILLNAVIAADLVDPLADPDADLTLFAPNDFAFVRLARDFGYEGWDEAGAWDAIVAALTDLGNGDPIPVLTDVLLYHVAPESITAFDFFLYSIFGIPIETLQGGTFQPFFFRLIDNEPDLRDARLFFPLNVRADNGYVHTITRLLIPVDLP
jgi:uncharacterized surface protein with fasciclin (FAS1) repeats